MKINVGVIFGGRSVENEISVISANQAINAIDQNKYNVIPIYITKKGRWYSGVDLLDLSKFRNIDSLVKGCDEVYLKPIYGDSNLYKLKKSLFSGDIAARLDVILPILHGTNCEDGTFQGLVEMTGIPYVGCNTLSSANGMDKITMKMILKECNIPVIDYHWFVDKEWFADKGAVIKSIEDKLAYPLIVKPANSGSSIGIKSAGSREALEEAIEYAISFTTRIIVESLVEDIKEVNCSVLGDYYENKASVCEVPLRSGDILSYEDKYMGGGAKQSEGMCSTIREIPARLPQSMTEKIREMACRTFSSLSCDGVARIDFIIDEKSHEVYVNEINTIPGSLSFYLWEYSGLNFSSLLSEMIDIAFKRRRELNNKTIDYGNNIFAGSSYSGKDGCKMMK